MRGVMRCVAIGVMRGAMRGALIRGIKTGYG